MSTKIQLRRDSAANFISVNPILGIGEPSFETDTGILKIGDGSTAYTSLPVALSTKYAVFVDRTQARPNATTVVWTGGTSGTPPANALTNDFWIHP